MADTSGRAQQQVSEDLIVKDKMPGRAALKSAIIPGWGQIQNKQYIKVPVIYGILVPVAYYVRYNHQQFLKFDEAYRFRRDDDSTTVDAYPRATDDLLRRTRDEWRDNRDLLAVLFVLGYTLNVLDAYVYSHLRDFDISDDLSLRFEPLKITNIAGNNAAMATVRLRF